MIFAEPGNGLAYIVTVMHGLVPGIYPATAILTLAWWVDDAHTVMAGEGRPSMTFVGAGEQRRGWPAFA